MSNTVFVYTTPGNKLYNVYTSNALAVSAVERLAEEGITAFVSKAYILRDREL